MLKKAMIVTAISLACFSVATPILAKTVKPTEQQIVAALLAQPAPKLKQCARMGIIGYQNALSGNYLVGRKDLPKNLVNAYAWAYVADERIQATGQKKLIKGQKKALDFISSKMSKTQITEGQAIARGVIKRYSPSWPAKPRYINTQFPAQCTINLNG